MAASAALASAACSGPPAELILPHVRSPEEQLPGRPLFYASSLSLQGFARGVLVETNDGRPTKVEGNPLHPASLGATDVFAQAAILDLWDPSRSPTPLRRGAIATWQQFTTELQDQMQQFDGIGGDGLAILTGSVVSPTLQTQLRELQQRYPRSRRYHYEPLHRDHELRGSELAFGRALDTRYRLDHARLLVSLDADIFSGVPASVRYARDFVQLRDPSASAMSRIYAFESHPTLLGAKADHRRTLPPWAIERLLMAIAHELELGPRPEGEIGDRPLLNNLIKELSQHRGEALLLPGTGLRPEAHALVHLINHRLDGQGKTFEHAPSLVLDPTSDLESIGSLTEAMRNGEVRTLLILGGNPAYDAPADVSFAAALAKVPCSIHLRLHVNETSVAATWHLPETHELEQWSDGRAFDGTANVVQPVIAPLYLGRSAHEVLNLLLQRPTESAHDTVRSTWLCSFEGDERRWRQCLRDGLIANTSVSAVSASVRKVMLPEPSGPADIAINFVADPTVAGGGFTHNGWLQELPHPFSKICWDNAAYISPATAAALQLRNGDEIEIGDSVRSVRIGVWVLPGQADRCISLPMGYGRSHAAIVGSDVGVNVYPLRSSIAPWWTSMSVRRTGRRHQFARTQQHLLMQGRDLIRSASLAEFARNSAFATDEAKERVPSDSLYPTGRREDHAWGMSIDLNACIGCNACTIACQAENNIPVVGKEQVERGREMHWLRIDVYHDAHGTAFQPVPCMHCEHAPCEEVCPVGATLHDSQGLNLQVYNRCVGTRFCSNNCPYKVRRFNYLQYTERTPNLDAMRNPDVTVRERGVMEKCTYCVQRIQRARIEAERSDRPLADGDVVTACQAVCPTQAIVFGDTRDPESMVSQRKSSPRNYALLAELNTRPRTTYSAAVTNTNPDVEDS